MNIVMKVVRMFAICCVCSIGSRVDPIGAVNTPNDSRGTAVTIEPTTVEVTDSSLKLSCEIRNGTDHEVWVCTSISAIPYEMYLTRDKQVLLIRKRLDVPTHMVWRRSPDPGTYIRLGPGTIRPESFVIDLPAQPTSLFASLTGEVLAQTVNRLVLEIGYYDENLPALVRSILGVADEISTQGWNLNFNLSSSIRKTYFRGLAVRGALSSFEGMNKDAESTGRVYINYSDQALTGEKVLRMEINEVTIPYKGGIEADY